MTAPDPREVAAKLLPCPFCGGAAGLEPIEPHEHSPIIKSLVPGLPDHPGSFAVECYDCDVGMLRYTEAEAIAAWNTRAHLEPRQ